MIERLFAAVLAWAFGLVRALLGGLLRAPRTAVENATRPVQIRLGAPDEVVDVRHAVLRQGLPRDTAIFSGDRAPGARHWVADRNGIVIGVVSVIPSEVPEGADAPSPAPRLQLRGMAVLAAYRGSGLGAELLKATHTEVAEPMWCNARAAVVPFYARYGWRPFGPVFEIPNVGPHQRMWWPGR